MKVNVAGLDLECKWIKMQTENDYFVTQYLFREGEEPLAIPLVGKFTPDWDLVKHIAAQNLLTIRDTSPLDDEAS